MKLEKGFKCPGALKTMIITMNMSPAAKKTMMLAEQTRANKHREMLKRKWVDVVSDSTTPKQRRSTTNVANVVIGDPE